MANTRSTTSRISGRWNTLPSSRISRWPRERIRRGHLYFNERRTSPSPTAPPSAPGLPPVGRQPQPEPQLWEWCPQRQDRCRDGVCLFAPGGAEGTLERAPEQRCPRNVLSQPVNDFAFTSAKPAARPTRQSWKHSSTPRWTPGATCHRHPCGSVPSVGRLASQSGFAITSVRSRCGRSTASRAVPNSNTINDGATKPRQDG